MKLLALVFGLGLQTFQTSFSIQTYPLRNGQLVGELRLLLLKGSQGLLSLSARVGLSPSLITGVPDPLLGCKNLLCNLHKNNEGIPYKKGMKAHLSI